MIVVLVAMALAQSADVPADKAAKEPRICRDSTALTGSHMRSGRRCLTQEQWDIEDARLANRSASTQITGHQRDALDPTTRPQ